MLRFQCNHRVTTEPHSGRQGARRSRPDVHAVQARRTAGAATAPRPAEARLVPPRPQAPGLHDPLPVPEVVEAHDESAWSQWEESQFQLDSQLGGLSEKDAVKVREGGAKSTEPDPFARIGKNHK